MHCVAGLQEVGKVIIGGDIDVFYSYNLNENNNSFRSIQGLSTTAEDVFQSCDNCPFPTYQKFVSFYGDLTYADQFVSAAFSGSSTGLRSTAVDFSSLSLEARAGKFQAEHLFWVCLESINLTIVVLSMDVHGRNCRGSHGRNCHFGFLDVHYRENGIRHLSLLARGQRYSSFLG